MHAELEAPVTGDQFPANRPRVMLVEDDQQLADLMKGYFARLGIDVDVEGRGDRAIDRVATLRPDLIILDIMLPGKDGFEVCRELRAAGVGTPILMLTARDDDIDRVLGLELGADEYLPKPVQPRVLVAHVRALLRRSAVSVPETVRGEAHVLRFGSLEIHRNARAVTRDGAPVPLTTAEFDLLWLLASSAGRVLSRHEILKELRGLEYDGVDRSIDSRVCRLRRRLGDAARGGARIKTIRPHGYLFTPNS